MNIKRAISAVIVIGIIVSDCAPCVYAAEPVVTTDEAVYVNLDYYGGLSDISIVKGCNLNKNSNFIDYGSYDSITNMTNHVKPVVNDEGVNWKLENAEERFYYECRPKEGTVILPWTFDVSYKLNGVPQKAEDLAGAKGTIEINIEAIPNTNANEYYKNNMLLQAATTINMEDTLSIEAPGAQIQSMGTYKAVVFAALPGEHATFTMRIGTDSFESTGVTMMMIPGTLKQLSDIKELKESKDKIKDSADAVNESLNEILGTLENMSNGLEDTKSGLGALDEARKTISSSKGEIYDNADKSLESLNKMTEQVNKLAPHMQNGQQLVNDVNKSVNAIVSTSKLAKEHFNNLIISITKVQGDVEEFKDMINEVNDLGEKREKVFKELKSDLSKLSVSLDDLRGDTRSMKTDLEALNDYTQNLKGISADVSNIGIAVESAIQALAAGAITPEQGGALGEAMSEVNRNVDSMEDKMTEELDSLSQFLKTTGEALDSLRGVLEEGSNITDSLKETVDISNEYFKALESRNGNAESLLEQTNKIGESAKGLLNIASTIIDNADELNNTFNTYEEGTISLLKDTEELTIAMGSGMASTYNFLTLLNDTAKKSGEELDKGTQLALQGMIDVIGKAVEGISSTNTIKNANNIIKDTIDKELNKYEEDSNLLNIDTELKPVSFTSDKNPAPESIQVILRTKEISLDNNDEGVVDLEKEEENQSIFARIGSVFKKMWEAIMRVF